MRATRTIFAVLTFIACCTAPALAKQMDGYAPREHHPWGQFKIGSWKIVRTQTETLDEKGAVASTSTTETTTKLVDIDADGYTLRIDVVVEVAGKRFTAQPQVIRRGFHGEAEEQTVSVKRVGNEAVVIAGKKIPCEVREVTLEGKDGKRITTVHYSERQAPFVLRRETTSLDSDGKPTKVQSFVEVLAIDMPHKVMSESKPSNHVRVIHHQDKSSTLTLEVHCAEVPGGLVAHTSKETDESGRVIRRSTLDLLEYGVGEGDDAESQTIRKAFHRLRNRRTR